MQSGRAASTLKAAFAIAAAMVVAMPAVGAGFSTIYRFTGHADGEQPAGILTFAGGRLYGTTLGIESGGHFTCQGAGCGTVFSLDLATHTLTTLHTFAQNRNGYFPDTGLAPLAGLAFGVASQGGTGDGVIFSLAARGAERTLVDLRGFETILSPLLPFHGALYTASPTGAGMGSGTANGVLFKVDPATGRPTIVHVFTGAGTSGGTDGTNPLVTPIVDHGALYGTTLNGGDADEGIIYRIDPATGAEQVLYQFQNKSDGQFPDQPIIESGVLYGTSEIGGTVNGQCSAGCGVAYKLDLATLKFTVLHAFDGTDGSVPASQVMVNGTLYVSLQFGGANGQGAIVALDPANGAVTTVHAFTGHADGQIPLDLAVHKGRIYGHTGTLSPHIKRGTIFEITP